MLHEFGRLVFYHYVILSETVEMQDFALSVNDVDVDVIASTIAGVIARC